MIRFGRQLRTPEERVGMLSNASLPPPSAAANDATEQELMLRRALEHGDEGALARALDRYFPAMLRIARTHVDSRATAEEVIQETWLAALQGFSRFEGRSSVKTWLFRILRNIARARARRDVRMRPVSELVPAHADTDPLEAVVAAGGASWESRRPALWTRGSNPEAELLAGELADQLDAAIAQLPPRQREVLVLRDVEQWSAAEVCNIMGISDTNQRVILHRARERVRTALRAYLDDEETIEDEQRSWL